MDIWSLSCRMLGQPGLDVRVLVSGAVVDHHVQLAPRLGAGHLLEKGEELLVAVTLIAGLGPRITLHFTPTSGSWLNLVEVFFSIITRQAIRRGSFASVKDLVGTIRRFIDGWNERCRPFTWTKAPDDILSRARPRKRTSDAGH